MKAYVGVSGFSYPSWRGMFYPKGAKSEELLARYSERLQTVEINSSFYAPPSSAMVRSWASKTSAGFRFSFKAPRLITHILKLGKGASEAAEKMSKTIDQLDARRGPLLFQLPPFSKLDIELLRDFLSQTSAISPRVFEFRHSSWLNDSVFALLEQQGAGFCIADTEDMEPTFQVTGGFAYFRLRKESYDEGQVDLWAERISSAARDAEECYVYLRHDESGRNAILAERLARQLGNTNSPNIQ